MTKTLLLTGSTGFLGQHTREALQRGGWGVICGVRRPQLYKGNYDCIHLDLESPTGILSLETEIRPNAIVHLACHVGWDGSDMVRMFTPNVLAVACLAYLARTWDAHLVFSSAAIVHGVRAESIDENSSIQADSPYGQSKVLAEDLIRAAGIKHTILRVAGIFGRTGPKHLGLNRAIDGALSGIAPTLIGVGSARRNYIYVKDAAHAIVYALEHEISGVHLVGGREVCSMKEMLSLICEVLAPGIEPEQKEGADGSNQIVSPSKVLPKGRTFREALADIGMANPI